MSLHKRTLNGLVTDTLTYDVVTADAYGAQVVDVVFFNGSGDIVTPTSGSYYIQWSVNGRDWMNIASVLAGSPIKNWQSGGYVSSVRVVPVDIVGAISWEFKCRTHGIGDPSASLALSNNALTAFDNGDSYRVDYPFSIANNGDSIVIKYIVNEPSILTLSSVEVDKGGIEYKVFAGSQTAELTPFNNPIIVYPKNTSVAINPSPISIFDGGSATFSGQQNTTARVKAPSSGGNRSSVVDNEGTSRGFGLSTVYVEISRIDDESASVKGVLKQEFYRK
jgi:hypothetical protein